MSQSSETQKDDTKPSVEDRIRLCFKNWEGKRKHYWIKSNDQLQKIMDDYCLSQSTEIDTLRFLFDDKRIKGHQTPDQIGLEDGDMIDVFDQHMGGGSNFAII